LLVGGEVAVEGMESEVLLLGQGGEGGKHEADLTGARDKGEDVAVKPLADELADSAEELELKRALVGFFVVGDPHVEALALGADPGGAEGAGDALTVEGGAHDDKAQIRAGRALEAGEQGKGQVRLEVALVELVEEHRAHAIEARRGKEHAGEGALGDEANPGPWRPHILEADAVAHPLAEGFFQLVGDPTGGEARGEAARLQDEDLPGEPGVEERPRGTGGLPCAGGGFQHQGGALAQGSDQLREEGIDGERLHEATLAPAGGVTP
jgi:hypothetical protein